MSKYTQKGYFSSQVKKSIVIKANQDKVWRKISNIIGLPEWVVDVKKTVFLSKTKRGVGAIRKLTFVDGNIIEEHVVSWKNKYSFSYVAVNGLPLRAYCATLSIKPISKKSVRLTWESYINSKKMTKKDFFKFVSFLGSFYAESLKNIKEKLEK